MAKKKTTSKEKPLKVNASFADIIKAATIHADKNSEKKRKQKQN